MAEPAACLVFDIQELLTKIVWKHVCWIELKDAIARLCTLKRVNRTWLGVATCTLETWLQSSIRMTASMERRIWLYTRPPQQMTGVERHQIYNRVLKYCYWTGKFCDQRGLIFPAGPQGETPWRLGQLLRYRKPKCTREMWHQCSQLCYCCGKACTCAVPNADLQSATLLHPYVGQIMPLFFQNTRIPALDSCGLQLSYLQSTVLPHTNAAEFISIEFKKEDGVYSCLVCTGPVLNLAERHYRNFMYAAKHQPWYQHNIMRLFSLRPKELRHRSPNRDASFMTKLPIYQMVVQFAPDASVAQIFGCSTDEMRNLIALGGRMRKEAYLMNS